MENKIIYRMVVVPDIHLKRTDPLGVIGEDGLNTRLRDKLNAVGHCVKTAVEKEATHLVFLGDIFETINPSEKLRELFWSEVAPAIEKDIEIRIIIGNHDMTGQTHNLASDKLTARKSIQIYGSGSHTEYLQVEDKQIVVNYIPYTEDKPHFHENTDILFAHLEVDGAILGDDNMPMRNPLKPKDIPGRLRWLGHIHKFQEFKPGFGYLGSCTQCGFGEVGQKKFFGVCDIMNDSKITFAYEEIPQRPMYQVQVEESNPDNLYISEAVPKNLQVKGALLKFKFVGSREWLQSVDKHSFKKRFGNAMKVEIADEKLDTDRVETLENKSASMEERVHLYAGTKKKGKEFLEVGVELAKLAKEIEL